MQERSDSHVVYAEVDVKDWLASRPTVARVRPKRCPCCGKAGQPAGMPLGLWGHGVRLRQVRGPLVPEGPAQVVTLEARRYVCRGCGATVTVLPRGLVARRYYAASAIGIALFLVGVLGLGLGEVRQRVCAWPSSFEGGVWAAPRRWVGAIAQGRLFGAIRDSPAAFTMRRQAERAAMTLLAMAPPPSPCPQQAVMVGAALAA